MNNALKRNLFIMKKNYMYNLMFMIISIPLWTITSNTLGSFNLTIPLMTYTSVNVVEQLESYYRYDLILNSLPVTRYEIIKAKFNSILIIYLVNVVLVLITHTTYSMFGVTQFIEGKMFILGMSLSFLYTMIYCVIGIALIYKYGYDKLKLYSAVMVMITICTVSIPVYMLNGSDLITLLSAILLIIGAVIYIISLKHTLKIYKDKEF